MTINSYFYDSVNSDRPYSGGDFAKAFGVILADGVVAKDNSGALGLDLGGTGGNINTIYAGKATVQGHFIEIVDTEILAPPAGDYSGMVVLRVDITTARIASLAVRTNQTPQQDSSIWELPLFNVTVANGVITAITSDLRVQGGALAKPPANMVTWTADPNGIYLNCGNYGGVNKPIKLFLTAAQPGASASTHNAWIQIDNF